MKKLFEGIHIKLAYLICQHSEEQIYYIGTGEVLPPPLTAEEEQY